MWYIGLVKPCHIVLLLALSGCAASRSEPAARPAAEPSTTLPGSPAPSPAPVVAAPVAVSAPADAGPAAPAQPVLRVEGAASSPADAALSTCTGRPPAPGTPLREVNFCDLLAEDAVRKLDPPARYQILESLFADIRPTWSAGKATLCQGDEAVLRVRKVPDGSATSRECVQLRCSSSFPPRPVLVGKNGEFCRSNAGTFEGWILRPGRVEAHYDYGTDIWHVKPIGDRYEFQSRD